jgi:DNA-directed RNA polymerase beta' subunit
MMNDEIPESVIKMQAWGSLKSNMLATYSHMTNKDMDRILLTKAGIITNGHEKEDELRPRQCSNCGKVHGPTTKFCDECGSSLTKEAEKERNTVISGFEAEEYTPDDIQKAISILKAMQKAKV